ncbi:MAG: FAD-dependent oxidoreductase [Alphaproteobacteria bacterium]|nr:FAD-dependent oxidoreductase [Alphaproteobacteria bacterium]
MAVSHTDFIVIGAGIAGASVAYELAGRGASVTILERETRAGMHSTGRSAAIFSEIYGNAMVRALSRATRRFLFEPPPGFTDVQLVPPRETLFIAPPDQVADLRAMRAEPDVAAGTKLYTREQAIARVPILRPEMVVEALLEPDANDIDVNALHDGFLRGAKKRGAALVTGVQIVSLEFGGGMWHARSLDETYAAPVVINAAGAWADEVAELAGVMRLGFEPKRRTVVTFDVRPDLKIADWPLTIDARETFYFKPDAGRLLLTPADETPSPPCDAQPEELNIAEAIDRFETFTTESVRRIAAKWAGLRTFAPDRTPVVGFDAKAKGFFWLAGQGGYGMQTSSAMARTAAALASREAIPSDIAAHGVTVDALAPDRFAR